MALVLTIKHGEVVQIGSALVSVFPYPRGNKSQVRLKIHAPTEIKISRTGVNVLKSGPDKGPTK